MDLPSLKTAYKYAAQLIAEAISELRKDKKDIITSLSTIKEEVTSRGKLSDTISEDILAKLQESLTELKNKEVTIVSAIQAIPGGGDPTSYALKYDEGATYTYIGNAVPGTATSAASWRIKRLTNADNTIVYAGGARPL